MDSTDKNCVINSDVIPSTTSTNEVVIVYPKDAEDTPINKNKPWRMVIRRRVTDGRSED